MKDNKKRGVPRFENPPPPPGAPRKFLIDVLYDLKDYHDWLMRDSESYDDNEKQMVLNNASEVKERIEKFKLYNNL